MSGNDRLSEEDTAKGNTLPDEGSTKGAQSPVVPSVPAAPSPSTPAAPPPSSSLLFSSRALAAGSSGRLRKASESSSSSLSSSVSSGRGALSTFGHRRADIGLYVPQSSALATQGKYLVVGDGLMAPFMALCLRVHGLHCDLAYHTSQSDLDRGTIVLTPSITQLMGDVLSVSVPSGSVVGRVLTFDHVGNDMSDLDLNEFREKGESPTFYCCDRLKIESALLSLCEVGNHSCQVLQQPAIDRGGLEALKEGGVRVKFTSGVVREYLGVICTARNQDLVPELTVTNEELQQREENSNVIKEAMSKAPRWMEVCVPPLPELGKFEKRFTPGSQEIVELLTPRDAKLIVRPTMMATKLFYNVVIRIPDDAADPRLRSTSMKTFWDDVVTHWTSNVPGYISHTMFRPLFSHVQQHFTKTSALVFRSPQFHCPQWSEGEGRLLKIAHSIHGSTFDSIDVSDAQGFTDCFTLARAMANGDDIERFMKERKLQVLEQLDRHALLSHYSLKDRGQMAYAMSRVSMKFLRRYKTSWRAILRNYITLVAK
jgi:hypothetical protein